MEEKSLKQSALSRAISDTSVSQKSKKFMWGGEGVLAVAGGAWLGALAPSNAPIWEIVGRAVFGGIGGLITAIIIVLIWNLFRAPYKQRNDLRLLLLATIPKVRLANKRELIKAINEVGHRALDVITYQGMLDVQPRNNDDEINQYTGIQLNRDDALVDFKKAIENVEGEELISGEPFKDIVANLTTFLYFQVWGNVQKPQIIGGEGKRIILQALDFTIALSNKTNKVIKNIEELTE